MKTIIVAIIMTCIATVGLAGEKANKAAEAFRKMTELIESNQFRIEVDRAYPVGGRSVDLFSNRGYITVNDTIAKGALPFFGRGYSVPYGEGGGIIFDNKIEKRNIDIRDKKKNKYILYRFIIKAKNDIFDINLQISSNNSCTVTINSNQRSSISYNGKIFPLDQTKKP